MIIDGHQHFWDYDPQRDLWITDEMKVIQKDFRPQDLEVILKRNNISGSVAVQAGQTEEETLFLLSCAKGFDFIKGVVGWVDLKNSALEQRLLSFSQYKKLKGFRHIVQAEQEGFLSDPSFVGGVQLLGKYNFTYDLLVYHYQLKEAFHFVKSVREVKIVIDHLAKPSIRNGERSPWKADLRALSAYENVYCKLSGMVTEALWNNWRIEDFTPYLDDLFEIFGTERVIYGSDWPVCLLAASYEEQLNIVLDYIHAFSEREKLNILGKNAERFYNL
ncbi:amidohydrolase family protein [Chryseosolibacter indicus]|uniref:Amidohydrolase family protein n=1 Tax=Chryseosolibacter indicus TaxID=2782351 RepID=A0ABS5VQ89_9BACT|nr:amidohydrolase family protein [Chryseosolibacter indicus]MBT1703506.1 amidohydrolase family protein [Chryseosolibacter indicus]